MSQAYGMSEAAGAHTVNINSGFRLESVGRTLPGMKTMLYEQDAKKNGEVRFAFREDRSVVDNSID